MAHTTGRPSLGPSDVLEQSNGAVRSSREQPGLSWMECQRHDAQTAGNLAAWEGRKRLTNERRAAWTARHPWQSRSEDETRHGLAWDEHGPAFYHDTGIVLCVPTAQVSLHT